MLTADSVRLLAPDAAHDRAAYSAPEQLRGRPLDPRSDIFAFGAVAYEMGSGRRAFPGTAAESRDAILSRPVDPLSADSPALAALASVIEGCLEKNPERRRQRIQNAVIELKLSGRAGIPKDDLHAPVHAAEHAEATVPAVTATPERPETRPVLPAPKTSPPFDGLPLGIPNYANAFSRRIWMACAAALALAASGIAAVVYLNKRPAKPVLKFAVTQPEHTSYPGMPAVSPDGRYPTFSAVGPEGKRMLWLRPLDALHATVIAGSEGASAPFWSPDSQYIAFFAGRALAKVKIAGGSPEKICEAEASPGGGAWNPDGTILFSPSLSDGFYRVPSSGGKPQLGLKLDEVRGERGDLWPHFLPDGKHFVFYEHNDNAETAGVYLGSPEPAGRRLLFASQTNAVYSGAGADSKLGYLLYINERNLMAVEFNTVKLSLVGEPIVLANDIGAVRSLSLAPISVSANGVLVYQGVGRPTRQMLWLDRAGPQISAAGEPGEYGPPRVSPDGNRGVWPRPRPTARRTSGYWIAMARLSRSCTAAFMRARPSGRLTAPASRTSRSRAAHMICSCAPRCPKVTRSCFRRAKRASIRPIGRATADTPSSARRARARAPTCGRSPSESGALLRSSILFPPKATPPYRRMAGGWLTNRMNPARTRSMYNPSTVSLPEPNAGGRCQRAAVSRAGALTAMSCSI
jgi:hypothetical protein